MNLENYFKEEDVPVAEAELKCIEHLQKLIELNLNAGELQQAYERSIDVLRSMERLIKLNKAKNNEDKLYNFLKAAHQDRINRSIWREINEN